MTSDPYKNGHGLCGFCKRGRNKWHDTQRDRDGWTATFRALRKRARRELKRRVEEEGSVA